MSASTSLRILPYEVGRPRRNMARDEALLRIGGPATFRLYGWAPPGLSLGYFQRAEPVAEVAGRHEVVRRLTGGGAIHHEHELTFCLVADSRFLPTAVADGYALVHDAVAAALGGIDVPVIRLRTGAAPGPRPARFWCFAEPGLSDLVDAMGRKLVGSAQRRVAAPRPRLLHHGSIVLRRPSATPFCAAIADLVDPDAVMTDLERLLVERVSEALGLEPKASAWTDAERELGERLEEERYGCDEFTYHRHGRTARESLGSGDRDRLL